MRRMHRQQAMRAEENTEKTFRAEYPECLFFMRIRAL